jgi:hypothetical protein
MNALLIKNSDISTGTLFLLYYGCCIAISYLIAWAVIFPSTIALVAVSALPILSILFMIVKKWRWGISSILIWFVIVDLIRKVLGGTKSLLILSDSLVAFVFLLFFLKYCIIGNRRVIRYIPKKLQLLFIGFSCIVMVQTLNPGIPHYIIRIAGFRSYLFYLPTIMLGLFLLRSEIDINRLGKFLLFLAIPVILFSFYQAFLSSTMSGAAFSSLGHKVHSFGNYEFDLISATFASSKRYGRFLFLIYPFIFSISVYKKKSKIKQLGLCFMFFAAAVISGSREIVVVLVLYHAFFWLFYSKKQINRFMKICIILLSAILIWNTILNFADNSIVMDYSYRIKATLANQETWKNRIDIYLFEPFKNITDSPSLYKAILGHGVGMYGQERTLLKIKKPIEDEVVVYGGDSGITKLIRELGLLGFFYFIFMYAIILKFLWDSLVKFKSHSIYPIALSTIFIPIGWFVLMVKAHTIISDGMVSFGLWFAVGIFISLKFYVTTGRFPAIDIRLK